MADSPRADGTAPAGEVWHFSEDPTIERFLPHVAASSSYSTPLVWACRPVRCPDYWFGRQTPRAMAWRLPHSDVAESDLLLGPGVQRLHVIEHTSVPSMTHSQLYAYRFEAGGFHDLDDFAAVSEVEQVPLAPPLALASPWELHACAGVPVLVVADLFDWWHRVIASSLGFSGIRLRNSPQFRGR